MAELSDAEDAKLVTLARAARARAATGSGAAVRDTDGRTYSAADLNLPSLQLTALQTAVAMAASSGVSGLEAAVVLSDAVGVSDADVAVVRDLAGAGVAIHRVDLSGVPVESVTT
ncbi:MAG: cytidine deaminase [Nocardioidaceae bacterium]